MCSSNGMSFREFCISAVIRPLVLAAAPFAAPMSAQMPAAALATARPSLIHTRAAAHHSADHQPMTVRRVSPISLPSTRLWTVRTAKDNHRRRTKLKGGGVQWPNLTNNFVLIQIGPNSYILLSVITNSPSTTF